MASYLNASEIYENYIVPLINDHRQDLAEARFSVLLREGAWNSRQKTTWSQTELTSTKTQILMLAANPNHEPSNFTISINEEVWRTLEGSDKTRMALIDHELSHCQKGEEDTDGNPKYYLIGHDVEDFFEIVRRHGAWNKSIENILSAYKLSGQQSLDFADPARDADSENEIEVFADDLTPSEDSHDYDSDIPLLSTGVPLGAAQ
ncbi:MAG: hypothetical protein FWG40_01225 [Peptococcaceae bacterium]|nr:hypothetical protein [Peptococcaceae bacterium]